MGFSNGSYARIFKLEDKGNYHVAQMSISRKNKDTNMYEQVWNDNFTRLVGTAHEQAKTLSVGDKGISVKIGNCDVTNKYDREKKTTYTNYVIFSFEEIDGNNNAKQVAKSDTSFVNVSDSSDELPFD